MTSFITSTFRRLRQNKLYASINVLGLAMGIGCVLLAVLYWKDERSFDSFHQKKKDIYRITTSMLEKKGGSISFSGETGQVQGPAFKAGVPEIMDYTRVLGGNISGDVLAGNKGLHLRLLFADESLFSIFTFPLLQGDPKTALKDISSVVITESAAKKLFNTTDVVGRQLQLDADPSARRLGKPMQITGVARDIPGNSSLQFDLLLPMRFLQLSFEDKAWLNAYLGTFVLLSPNADKKAVIAKMNRIYSVYAKDQLAENIRTYGFDPSISYGLQPLTGIHLHPLGTGVENGIANGSSPVFSYLMMTIAVFMLLMAGINFITTSMADSLRRAKEVGIRKISGASRTRIVLQFLRESAVSCFIAFLFAILLAKLALPVFNNLTNKHILVSDAFDGWLLLTLIGILSALILFTGIYPAWTLSRFNIKEVLYNKQKLSGRNFFGRSLVVLQFALSVFLLIATLVYYNQMDFIRTSDLGYNMHEVIQTQIQGDREIMPIYRFMRSQLAGEPSIKAVSLGGGQSVYEVKVADRSIEAIHKVIDENYLSVLEIPLRTGRNLLPSYSVDSSHSVLVNEAFVKAAHLEHPIGVQLRTDKNFDNEPKVIVGVTKDFHVGSLREPIKPMVMFMNSWYGHDILVKLEKTHQQEGLAALEKVYKTAIPQAVYEYHFLDELNAKQYQQEQRWQQVIGIATMLSIVICCLGLFGLAHLATHQRVKEIGIRKVLGATVTQIVTILSTDFLKLVLIAVLIASPFAWFVMNRWLRDFAYRINIGAWIFAAAGLIAVSIALASVAYQTIRAARANPVKSLGRE